MTKSDYEMRRSFIYQNGELRMCDRRGVSCRQWLVDEQGMSEEELSATVHGAFYPGRVYFYKGLNNTTTDEEVEEVAEKCRQFFNEKTEICCGAVPGEVGKMWKPIKTIGFWTGSR